MEGNGNNKENEDSEYRNPRFLYCLMCLSLFQNAHVYFSDSLLV